MTGAGTVSEAGVGGGARPIGEMLLAFVRSLADVHDAESIFRRLGEVCTELPGVDGIGLLVLRDDGGLAVGTVDTAAGRTVERAESELGEGPCSEAVKTGEAVLVPDLASVHDRYPAFVPVALDAGVRAIHALPVHHGGQLLGALDIITFEPGPLATSTIGTAQLLGEVAAAYAVHSRALQDQTVLAEQLQTALDNRMVIEQAKGKVAEQHGVDVDEAFERIRRYARSSRRKLREVASEVIRGELRIPE